MQIRSSNNIDRDTYVGVLNIFLTVGTTIVLILRIIIHFIISPSTNGRLDKKLVLPPHYSVPGTHIGHNIVYRSMILYRAKKGFISRSRISYRFKIDRKFWTLGVDRRGSGRRRRRAECSGTSVIVNYLRLGRGDRPSSVDCRRLPREPRVRKRNRIAATTRTVGTRGGHVLRAAAHTAAPSPIGPEQLTTVTSRAGRCETPRPRACRRQSVIPHMHTPYYTRF